MSRRGGTILVQRNGEVMDAKGSFSVNLGRAKREAIVGQDRVHGYKEMPQVGFVEGTITDRGNLDVDDLVQATDETFTLEMANGKVYIVRNAYFAGEGTVTTEEGEIEVRFEGDVEEVL